MHATAKLSLVLLVLALPVSAAKPSTPQILRVTPVKHAQPIEMHSGRDAPRFTRVPGTERLSVTKVDQIVQDDQGFLWFGTPDGLRRFDGYALKLYVHDPNNSNSLSGVSVTSLFKDRSGKLWIGCEESVNRYDPASGLFSDYPVPDVTHISQDKAGVLWFSSRAGLFTLVPESGRIQRFAHDQKNPLSLSSTGVKSTGEDTNGQQWVATSAGLDQFDAESGRVKAHIPLVEPSSRLSFYEDRFGAFWVFRVSDGTLARLDRVKRTVSQYAIVNRTTGKKITGFTSMVEDQEGTLWIGTHGAGLLKFDRNRNRLVAYGHEPDDGDSLPQDNVEALFADREGSIWVGLGSRGVVRFSTKPLMFSRLLNRGSRNLPNGDPFVGAIYQDREGVFWVGTPRALHRVDRRSENVTAYTCHGAGKQNIDAIAIEEDTSGNIWVGTYGHGLLRLNRRTGRFTTFKNNESDPSSLADNFVASLLVDRSGTLWAATAAALHKYNPVTNTFSRYYLDSREDRPFYLEVVEGKNRTLWLGTEHSGLKHFDPSTGTVRTYRHEKDRPGTLSNDRVNSVLFDRSGVMWVGTQNGLNRFDQQTGRFVAYTRRNGLPGNTVGCVLEDASGNLWMSTNEGLSKFDSQRQGFSNYSVADGLPGPNLTGWGACARGPDGELSFGGFSGGTSFLPNKGAEQTYDAPVVITELSISGIAVESDAGSGSLLRRPLSYATHLVLSPNQNVFSLGFSRLSYTNPLTSRYRYRLEGLDSEWNEVGSDRRFVAYGSLPARKYLFRLQGARSGGNWGEPGLELGIEILPPWWATLEFKMSAIVFTALALWAIYQVRVRQLNRHYHLVLEERLSERTRLAQELHDTLLQGVLSACLYIDASVSQIQADSNVRRMLTRAVEMMRQVVKESRNAVGYLRSSEESLMDLSVAFSRVQEELAVQGPEGQMPVFKVIVEGERRRINAPIRDDLYRIGREAIANAFRHADATEIEVEMRYLPRRLLMIVRDNGRGIEPYIVNSGREGHWGLPGMRERADRIGGTLSVSSKSSAGTEVRLVVPANIAYQTESADATPTVKNFLRGLFRP